MSRPLAVVTGASSGIGRATALQAAAAGFEVALLGRHRGRLSEAAGAIRADGGAARSVEVDLTDDEALERVAAELASEPIAALVHSAGAVELGAVASAPVDQLDRQYRVNLRAPFLLTQLLLEALRAGSGQVVFINSTAGLDAKPEWSQYAATKFGLRALADSLRQELAADGVRVTSIYPGRTASPMQEKVRRQEGGPYRPEAYLRSDDVARQVVMVLTTAAPAALTDLTLRPG